MTNLKEEVLKSSDDKCVCLVYHFYADLCFVKLQLFPSLGTLASLSAGDVKVVLDAFNVTLIDVK